MLENEYCKVVMWMWYSLLCNHLAVIYIVTFNGCHWSFMGHPVIHFFITFITFIFKFTVMIPGTGSCLMEKWFWKLVSLCKYPWYISAWFYQPVFNRFFGSIKWNIYPLHTRNQINYTNISCYFQSIIFLDLKETHFISENPLTNKSK